MVENENKFVEYLRFQISQKYKSDHIVKNISMFHTQLEDRNEKIIQMIDFYEDMKRKDIYNLLVQEFNNLIDK
ncbi:MAG: hypothetical protein EU531_01380 [Promethearchaeota archaeon]|nr:MAG: hypothetical protein EU531_01380 [Candidatus Lokiarchaeota archaeon]